MFVGHLAAAFAGTAVSRTTPVTWFVAAACLVDFIWPVLLLAGIEHASVAPGATAFTPLAFEWYPWSHSLLTGVLLGAVLGGLARWFGVSTPAALVIGGLVVSHWVLDLVTHRPDLPLYPGDEARYGLGLWYSVTGTFVVEGLMWAAAIVVFLAMRRLVGAGGRLAFWSFVLVSTVIWATGPFSPPPPDERSLAVFALIGLIMIPWAWWIDRTSDAGMRRDSVS